jgi:hypothetical protein
MQCSNLGFLYELERSGNVRWMKKPTDQLALWSAEKEVA